MTQAEKGKVYLVGAGPGDPELLTVKAAALLATADVIYHDDLVAREILELARTSALVISVGKRCGAKRVTQGEINHRLIESAQRGLGVVRLKSGDPLIFGRASEEIHALEAAGVAHEIVPGISAGFAAAAALGCSLTERGIASSVVLLSAHHAHEKNPELSPTRVVYMPGSDLKAQAKAWLESGEPPDLPCVLVTRVSQPDQSIVHMRLEDLLTATVSASPSILLAGRAVGRSGTDPVAVNSFDAQARQVSIVAFDR
jgi:uroporphyrin-III C-methyltransferase